MWEAWEVDYRGNQEIMRGLLRKAGRLSEMTSLFLDLNVAGARPKEEGAAGGAEVAAANATKAPAAE